MSGREVFEFRPDLIDEDDEEATEYVGYASDEDEDQDEEVMYRSTRSQNQFESEGEQTTPSSYSRWLFSLAA